MFDEAMRLCGGTSGRGSLEAQVGGMRELGTVEERAGRALSHWGRLLDLATVARSSGEEWNNELAEREKRNVSVDACLTLVESPLIELPLASFFRRATLTSATTTPRPTSTRSTPSPPPRSSTHKTPSTGPTLPQQGSRSAERCSRLPPLLASRTSADDSSLGQISRGHLGLQHGARP